MTAPGSSWRLQEDLAHIWDTPKTSFAASVSCDVLNVDLLLKTDGHQPF